MTDDGRLALSHVGIYVRDLEAMTAFYTRLFGLTVTDRDTTAAQRLVFLSASPEEHHQIVLAKGRPEDVSFNVINQITFRIGSLRALQAFHERLAGEPVRDIRPVTHGMAWSVYFLDPEGNRIEVFADTPWYVQQPFSTPLQLTRPEADILAETEALCRGMPGFMPRARWREEISRTMGAPA